MNKCRVRCNIGNSCIGEDEVLGHCPKTVNDVDAVLDNVNPVKLKLPRYSLDYASETGKTFLYQSDTHSLLSFKTLEGKVALIEFIAM